MIIDIKRTVIRTQLRRLATLLIVCAIILFIILQGNVKNEVLGLNKYEWGAIIGVLYCLALIGEGFFELNYIFFSDKNDILVFRFFSMSVFGRKKNSIEIPKKMFIGYEIKKAIWGIKKSIVLLQKIKDETARYSPVSISSLNKEQYQALLKTLDKYIVK